MLTGFSIARIVTRSSNIVELELMSDALFGNEQRHD
jgi:hypothetical protein